MELAAVFGSLVLLALVLEWGTLVQAQAPGDASSQCRQDERFASDHVFPPDLILLVDSYDYSNLYDDRPGANPPPAWVRGNFDGDDGDFLTDNNWDPSSGGSCVKPLTTCSTMSSTTPQNNWVFTQYIQYRDAVEVIFNITHNFRRCTNFPTCNITFITLYKYDTDGIVDEGMRTNIDNYQPLFGTEEASRLDGAGSAVDVTEVLRFPPTAGREGFYLGFRDTGTCVSIGRIFLYYMVALGRMETFLQCPDVPLPSASGQTLSTLTCTCVNGTTGVGSLERSCDLNGICNEDQSCRCSAGFGYNSTLETCIMCPVETFKADVSNTSCIPCPVRSEARDPGSTMCECIPPNSRGSGDPDEACRDRRFSTAAAVAITFFVTLLVVGVVAFLGGGVVAFLCRKKIEKIV